MKQITWVDETNHMGRWNKSHGKMKQITWED